MKAAYIEETGPPEVIQFGEVAEPVVGPTQVLVDVTRVSVNPIDTYIRNGANFWELPRPFVVGCDLAGRVSEVGSSVTRFRVGDRVWGSNQGLLGRQGTFAERAAVDESWLYPSPDGVSDEDLAAIALVGITAHIGLFKCAGLTPGETVIVNGGSGSVGSTVVQMAKAVGARVIATAGGAEHCEQTRQYGADVAVDYRADDATEQLRAAVDGGAAVYWETVREPDFDRILGLLADGGRIVLMAGRDARPPFPVGPFYVKGCSLHGFAMFKEAPQTQRRSAEDIARWLESGRLKAHIGQRMELHEAAAAHRLQEDNTLRKAGTLCGKIVLRVQD